MNPAAHGNKKTRKQYSEPPTTKRVTLRRRTALHLGRFLILSFISGCRHSSLPRKENFASEAPGRSRNDPRLPSRRSGPNLTFLVRDVDTIAYRGRKLRRFEAPADHENQLFRAFRAALAVPTSLSLWYTQLHTKDEKTEALLQPPAALNYGQPCSHGLIFTQQSGQGQRPDHARPNACNR